ncbi:antitoxin [Streptomyces sp. KM273126]|uniref:antitoxin n=1 Tax=Streptomyces sp. KM273126 TaxID=2545247 RepID=UPI00103D83D0|nr:antitoxin [Streptomyces sp. KM273126]MBA2806733.1 antitoxin [Streptomyces sp. KM273126]
MGIFDRFKNRAHQDKAKEASDAAERKINERTGDRYADQVDQAQQRVEGSMGIRRDEPPEHR